MICSDCGATLTDEEAAYYEDSCDSCQAAWSERLDRWRNGGEDLELDEVFGAPRPAPRVLH